MQHVAISCKQNKLAVWQSTAYYETGQMRPEKSWQLAPEATNLQDAIPNSVGEQMVKTVCAIYN
jgi:hypothetical protein